MSLLSPTGVPAASGYPQYSGTPAIPPMFSSRLVERFYCSSVFGEIATTDYIGELTQCGDQVTFQLAPSVIVRDHIKDGPIKHDTLEATSRTLVIDRAKQFSWKLSHVDMKQMCNSNAWVQSALTSATRASAEAIDRDILGEVYVCADRANRGANAGIQSHMHNLGVLGAPLVVDESNIYLFLLSLKAVLDEQCVPVEDRWLVVPSEFHFILMKAGLCAVCNIDPANSSVLNGRMPEVICGFRIYQSHNLTRVVDPATNQNCYNIMAGYRGSVVFASQLEQSRVVDNDKDSWDTYFQGLMVYGFGVIQPTGLVHSYITFG